MLIILAHIDRALTLMVLCFLPVMFVFALHFSRRMIAALRLSKDRIGDINARVEDSLVGIRVVKSFTNEAFATARFNYENDRFLASRSEGYQSEAWSRRHGRHERIPIAVSARRTGLARGWPTASGLPSRVRRRVQQCRIHWYESRGSIRKGARVLTGSLRCCR